jgi:3'(2'), 5'-bisphosphate nucleotidase
MLDRELDAASELARQAGRIVLELYATGLGVDWKTATEPVTEADRRANAFLVAGLRAQFAGDGIVSEENADHGDALSRPRCWFVDPLDGTKEFIAKNGEFAVMLGLAIEGEATLGVVYQPVADKLYQGVLGQGASLSTGGTRRALTVSSRSEPAELRLVVSRSHRSRDVDRLVQRLGIRDEQASGSVGLKVGRIAEQDADLYVHMSPRSSRWDACGPEAILRAAGGRFTDVLGRPLDYRSAELRNVDGLLACNDAAYERVLEVVREIALDERTPEARQR